VRMDSITVPITGTEKIQLSREARTFGESWRKLERAARPHQPSF
jgi:hypothetical protein